MVEGMAELSKKFNELEKKLGAKALRQAAKEVTDPVLKEMKAAIPVGKVAHKIHTGRWVLPGFAKKSIRRRISVRKGRVFVIIGVLSEAFYAVQFVDWGTKKMTATHWFKLRFTKAIPQMQKDFASILKAKIIKIAR